MRAPTVAVSLAAGCLIASGSAAEPPETVVLLHGMGRTPRSMAWLGRQIEQRGFQVVNLGYPSTRHPIEVLVGHVRDGLEREGVHRATGRVHFVTHSLGGIVLRAYLKESRPTNLGRVVMLGPPNRGSEVIDRLRRNAILRLTLSPAGRQIGTEDGSVPNQLGPVDFELGVIAGSRSLNPLLSAWIPGVNDGKVSVERARAEGMKDFLVVPHTHTFMMRRRAVALHVLRFLEQGRFSPEPP